ncbi:hypoxanthine phosphoribosyltransferase [Bartonella tamiae]|uniref:Hypoxanthine phosphoribosyltransferase n=1 Tax=Bartonella tamiae Th239 TaxID=1094558 RepID=J1K223_9HYPH|nr:hypoxanthine phosphoribosyltransferase [Bartonella tamiae]EJF91497.1 hypoxanthine phosphoribosyltransferase [Bartonella tamiae Th239]EJF92519.1 hypoxanthine phosphoribosyltransferase [Bartonella tamiae Th307]
MPVIHDEMIDILFSEDEIALRNAEIAKDIAQIKTKNLLVLPILKGSFVFAADLIRELYKNSVLLDVEFLTISSYGSGQVSGAIHLLQDSDLDFKERDVLLVDDILESGNTLKFVHDLLYQRGAKRVMTAVLLDKTMCRKANIQADFVGFSCPNQFVVGYGMDDAHAYRQLPFVGVKHMS